MEHEDKMWVWGYTLDKVPGAMNFVDGKTDCSLETAVKYLSCENVMWLNSLHSMDLPNEEQYQYVKDCKNVICGLAHIETNGPGKGGWKICYKESAAKVADFSLTHPNVKGALIDDFRSPTGPSKDFTVEELKEVYTALKKGNPALKLYVVAYFNTQVSEEFLPFREYFDGFSLWDWNSSDYFWDFQYEKQLRAFREMFPEKTIIQGQFLHAFGDGNIPQPMCQMEKQCDHIAAMLDEGVVQGWCILQNGYMSRINHRKQIQYLKEYWDWYRGTRTLR